MTDINKLIEEEAKDRFSQKAFRGFTNIENTIAITEFKYGGLFILHHYRWRKVSEELPEVRDESYQILIRIPNIKSSATAWNIRNQSDCDIIAKMGNSEWKPIE